MSSREKKRSRGTKNAGLRRPILPHLRLHAWFPFHEQTFFFTHPENVIYARSLLLNTPQGRLRPSIALKTTRTSYQLFFGDNPRPRAGSSASYMARMKMEGHAGRFPSLSRHTWSQQPTIVTNFQEVKSPPPVTPNPPPFAFRTSSGLVPAAHRGCWCVVETFRRRYTLLVREMPPQAPLRPVHRASHMARESNFRRDALEKSIPGI